MSVSANMEDDAKRLADMAKLYADQMYTDEASFELYQLIELVEHCNKLYEFSPAIKHLAVQILRVEMEDHDA